MLRRFIRPAILIAATAALGACTSYGGYGRTYASVGYGSGGYYPYSSRYTPYGYYGWYDDYYYPGTGYYVYDRHGRKHRWNDRQRGYWEGRRGDHRDGRPNWEGYHRDNDRDGRHGDYSRDRDHRRDGNWDRQHRDRDDRQSYRDQRRSAPVAGARDNRRVERRSERSERRSKSVDRGREFRKKSRD